MIEWEYIIMHLVPNILVMKIMLIIMMINWEMKIILLMYIIVFITVFQII